MLLKAAKKTMSTGENVMKKVWIDTIYRQFIQSLESL